MQTMFVWVWYGKLQHSSPYSVDDNVFEYYANYCSFSYRNKYEQRLYLYVQVIHSITAVHCSSICSYRVRYWNLPTYD